jgi:aerobic-type carbon monoxide dehydrogenase small subunit (CoxS/CutS family)
MYAINEGMAKINGVPVETFEREVVDGNSALRVEAGTTGYKGGCCRNAGGRTYVCIDCLCGDFYFSPVTDDEKNVVGIEIAACGDDGLNAVMKALAFAMEALNDQRCEVDD